MCKQPSCRCGVKSPAQRHCRNATPLMRCAGDAIFMLPCSAFLPFSPPPARLCTFTRSGLLIGNWLKERQQLREVFRSLHCVLPIGGGLPTSTQLLDPVVYTPKCVHDFSSSPFLPILLTKTSRQLKYYMFECRSVECTFRFIHSLM